MLQRVRFWQIVVRRIGGLRLGDFNMEGIELNDFNRLRPLVGGGDVVVWNWHDRNPLSLQREKRQIGCVIIPYLFVSSNPTDMFNHGKACSNIDQHDPCTSTSKKKALITNQIKHAEMILKEWESARSFGSLMIFASACQFPYTMQRLDERVDSTRP